MGAQTQEGIKIIDVGGASNGVFSLQGDYVYQGEQAVVGGAYAYKLYQGGKTTPGDGDWYLRSELITPTSVGPLYQPGVPLYETYASSLQTFNTLGTWQQRIGNRSWASTADPCMPCGGNIIGNGTWIRVTGAYSKLEPTTSTSSTTYDVSTWKLQPGIDRLLVDGPAGQLVGGVFARLGTISADVASRHGDGVIASTGYGVGGTLTFYSDSGFYLDSQAHATWYDSDLSSGTAGLSLANSNHGFGNAVSLEAGRRIATSANRSLRPQAQLIYSSVEFNNFTDAFGTNISHDHGDNLTGRLGMSADYRNQWKDQSCRIHRANIYGIANLYYDFLNGTSANVGGTTFISENDPFWGGLGIGGLRNWCDDRYSLYGEASVNTSLDHFGNSYSIAGTLGLRVAW